MQGGDVIGSSWRVCFKTNDLLPSAYDAPGCVSRKANEGDQLPCTQWSASC